MQLTSENRNEIHTQTNTHTHQNMHIHATKSTNMGSSLSALNVDRWFQLFELLYLQNIKYCNEQQRL